MSLKPTIIVVASIVALAAAANALRGKAPEPGEVAAEIKAGTPSSRKASTASLKRKAMKLNEACRGGAGPDNGAAACVERDQLMAQLERADVCWGNENQAGPERDWQSCTASEPRPTSPKRSALYDIAHPEARRPPQAGGEGSPSPGTASDTVAYSLEKRAQNQLQAASQYAVEECIDGVVQVALNAGMKSRAQIGDYVAPRCAHVLQTAYPNLSEDAALAGAKNMALGRIDFFASRGQ